MLITGKLILQYQSLASKMGLGMYSYPALAYNYSIFLVHGQFSTVAGSIKLDSDVTA